MEEQTQSSGTYPGTNPQYPSPGTGNPNYPNYPTQPYIPQPNPQPSPIYYQPFDFQLRKAVEDLVKEMKEIKEILRELVKTKKRENKK